MLFYSTDTQRARVSPQGLSAEQDRHCLAFVESGITKVTSKLEGINTMKERNRFLEST